MINGASQQGTINKNGWITDLHNAVKRPFAAALID
jgi:hypothetical protein